MCIRDSPDRRNSVGRKLLPVLWQCLADSVGSLWWSSCFYRKMQNIAKTSLKPTDRHEIDDSCMTKLQQQQKFGLVFFVTSHLNFDLPELRNTSKIILHNFCVQFCILLIFFFFWDAIRKPLIIWDTTCKYAFWLYQDTTHIHSRTSLIRIRGDQLQNLN